MSEDQVLRLQHEMASLEQHYVALSQQESRLGAAYREAESAISTLSGFEDGKAYETLVPVGLGVFVGAKIGDAGRVVLNVGAGVCIEKDRKYAIDYIEARIKEIGVALQDTAGRKQEVSAKMQQSRSEVERIVASASGRPAPAGGNV